METTETNKESDKIERLMVLVVYQLMLNVMSVDSM